MLAKQLDYVDKPGADNDGVDGEGEEWMKVWTSLFVRDKSFSLSRGKGFCLPAFDWSPLTHRVPDSRTFALLELTRIHEEAYFHLFSKESSLRTPSRRASSMHTLRRALNQWEEANNSMLADESSTADLQLKFRSVRVLVLRLSADQDHKREVLNDARAACRILTSSNMQRDMHSRIPLYR
jgi:hypothetical protein